MKRNHIITLTICLLISVKLSLGQDRFKPLVIGDTIPNLEFKQVINYERENLKLTDFNGKVIILDFWNTWCKACLSSFPKLERLKEQYENEVEIILVVNDEATKNEKYLDFFRKRAEEGSPITLTCIIDGGDLVDLFPHKSIPYVVWISRSGVVKKFSQGKELNSDGIREILQTTEKNKL